MKKNLTSSKIIFIILIFTILSSCQNANTINNRQNKSQNLSLNSIEDHLNYLTSEECSGRLVGTEGNLNAQKYIIKYLSDIGIKPYEQKYEQAFSYEHVYLNDISLKINDKELEYEKDYRVHGIPDEKNIEISEIYNNECETVFLQKGNELPDDRVKISIFKLESGKMKNPFSIVSDEINRASIKVTEEIYGILEKGNDVKIDFSINHDMKKTEENNIVGIISNDVKNTSAIVLSAHFDHVGSVGETVFEGALDNASGTCTLLNIAKILQEKAETNKLKRDIIIVFFNSEEGGLHGSKEFAKQLSLKYKDIININFDCISEVDKNGLDITNDNLSSLVDLDELMKKVGISENKMFAMMSDHKNFKNGINIGYDDGTIHTTRDKADNISLESIAKVSEGAADFALNYAYKETKEIENSDSDLKYEIIFSERDKLKLGEYKYMDIEGEIELIEQNRFDTNDFELVKKEFEFMKIFDEYSLTRFYIHFRENEDYNYITDYELGKVYKKDMEEYNDGDFLMIGFSIVNDNRTETMTFSVNKFYSDTIESRMYEDEKSNFGEKIILPSGQEIYTRFDDEMGNVIKYIKEYDGYNCIFTFQNFKNIEGDSKIQLVDDFDTALKNFEEKDIINLDDKFVDLFD